MLDLTNILFFSEVFKAKDKKTGRIVALKKILMENEKEGVSFLIFFNTLYFFWGSKSLYNDYIIISIEILNINFN